MNNDLVRRYPGHLRGIGLEHLGSLVRDPHFQRPVVIPAHKRRGRLKLTVSQIGAS